MILPPIVKRAESQTVRSCTVTVDSTGISETASKIISDWEWPDSTGFRRTGNIHWSVCTFGHADEMEKCA